MISFVCPTKNRSDRHYHLWRQYAQQTIWPKELIVCDDSEKHSVFFQQLFDPTIRYIHCKNMTLGDKRNYLNACTNGDVIVHLDDDDYYEPDYAQHMLQRLRGHNLARLSRFRIFDERDGSWYDCNTLDPSTGKLVGPKWNSINIPAWLSRSSTALRFGYGFSYVYQKLLWMHVPFNKSLTIREDVDFVKRALHKGALIRQVDDGAHLATHVVHGGSTSTAFTTSRLGSPIIRMLAKSAISNSVGGGPFGLVFGYAVDRAILR
jgi:glycosyltransferase involved in cell wall biosynthesis